MSGFASPLHTYAGLVRRSPHLVHVFLHNQPEVVGYQFWGHGSVNDAYGNPGGSGVGGAGPSAMFRVARGISYRSPTLRRKGLGLSDENRRGTTHAAFDIDDFLTPGGSIPTDGDWLFLRAQEERPTTGLLNFAGAPADPCLGPIYCVPPPPFFGTMEPAFTLHGTAPSGSGSTAGGLADLDPDLTTASPRAMYLVFPRPLMAVTVRNVSANAMLVSFGIGQLMRTLPAGGEMPLYSGTTKELLLACPVAGGADFTVHGVSGGA